MPATAPSLFGAPKHDISDFILHARWYNADALDKVKAKEKPQPDGDALSIENMEKGGEGQRAPAHLATPTPASRATDCASLCVCSVCGAAVWCEGGVASGAEGGERGGVQQPSCAVRGESEGAAAALPDAAVQHGQPHPEGVGGVQARRPQAEGVHQQLRGNHQGGRITHTPRHSSDTTHRTYRTHRTHCTDSSPALDSTRMASAADSLFFSWLCGVLLRCAMQCLATGICRRINAGSCPRPWRCSPPCARWRMRRRQRRRRSASRPASASQRRPLQPAPSSLTCPRCRICKDQGQRSTPASSQHDCCPAAEPACALTAHALAASAVLSLWSEAATRVQRCWIWPPRSSRCPVERCR